MSKQQFTRLGDVVTVVNDNEYEPEENGIKKYVAGGHIEPNKFYVKKFGDVSMDKEIIGSAFHKLFKKGHILYKTRFPNSGAIATFDGLCSNTTLVLKTKKSSDLIEGLLPFILSWDKFDEHIIRVSVGSTNSYVRWRDLAKFEFVLPPKPEQIKLHEIFWSIQHSIDNVENLIEKSIIHYISRREALLTRGIGHTKFKKVKWMFGREIRIPDESDPKKQWRMEKLGKNSTIKGRIGWQGLTTAEYRKDGNFHLVTGTDFKDGRISWESCVYVDEDRYEQDAHIQLKTNDVLVTKDGTIGKIALVDRLPKPTTLNTGVLVIRPIEDSYIPLFFYYILESNYFAIFLNVVQSGSTIDHLYQGDFENFVFPVPPVPEQQKITTILSNINEQTKQFEKHLSKLKVLRRSILNSKLTAKEK